MTKQNSNGPIGGLQERAMLVDLTVHRWYAKTTDHRATREVIENHKMNYAFGKFRKRLLAKEALAEIATQVGYLESEHKRRTLAWDDKGNRVLSTDGYFDYIKAMNARVEKVNAAVKRLLDDWDEHVRIGKEAQGDLADDKDYPTRDQIADRFRVTIRFSPITNGNDFRVNLATKDLKAIQSQIDTDYKDHLAETMKEPWQRLYEVVNHMVERLNAFDVKEVTNKHGKKKVQGGGNLFQDVVVKNIEKLLDLLPSLNITKDPKLEAAAKVIREKLVKDPDQLRNNEDARAKTAAEAEKIAKRLSDFI
jgi:arsenate reductase-like glutaredoxin family protein